MNNIKTFSTSQLLAELELRERGDTRPFKPCDECVHFIPSDTDSEAYNPCDLGHKMQFRVPKIHGDAWGFYRRNCRDRKPDKPIKQRNPIAPLKLLEIRK